MCVCKRWPFDWKTPIGYLVAWVVQGAEFAAAGTIGIPCYNIIFGSNWLFIAMVEDITNDIVEFNNRVKILKANNEVSDRAKLKKSFCNVIQNYSDVKQ